MTAFASDALGKARVAWQGNDALPREPNLAKRTVTSVAPRLRQLSTEVDDAPMLSTDSSSGIDLSRPDGTLNPMIITHAELLATGMSAASVRHDVRRGDLLPLCRGVYVPRDDLPLDEQARHRLRVLGSATRSGYVVSHASAAVLHGLPVGWADLSEVHMTRMRHGGGRLEASRRVHAGVLDPEWCMVVDGVLVTTVARTVVDLAKIVPLYVAVGAADAAVHLRLCTMADLRAALQSVRGHPYSRRSQLAVSLVDGRSESPGESRTRLVLNQARLPATELQISIHDELGRFVGRADGGYTEAGVLWEFDGKTKYGRLLKPGQSVLDVVLDEKERESGFTELGWITVRVVNRDFAEVAGLRGRMMRAVDRSTTPGWLPPRGHFVLTPRFA